MSCPTSKKPVIEQFSNNPDSFWHAFEKAHPSKSSWIELYFDEKYGQCFGLNAGVRDASNLPIDVKEKIRLCMLRP